VFWGPWACTFHWGSLYYLPVFGGLYISLGVPIIPVFWGLCGCIFHWGSLYSRCFGDTGDAYFTGGPYTPSVLKTLGIHISLGVSILPVFGGLQGCIFHWGSLYSRCFGDSGDAHYTGGPYTPGVLRTPGMHFIFHWGPYTPGVWGTPGMHISLGVPILLVFWSLRGSIFH
jgi:hypothetical protein